MIGPARQQRLQDALANNATDEEIERLIKELQEAIHRYRERWLGLMDVWERADAAIQAESGLGTARAEEAIRLLDSAAARPPRRRATHNKHFRAARSSQACHLA